MRLSWPTAVASDGLGAVTQSSASPSTGRPANLTVRLLTALVGIPLLAGVVWAGDPWYTLVTIAVALVAAWEFSRLARAAAGDPWSLLLYSGTLLFLLDARFSGQGLPILLTGTLLFSLLWSVVRYEQEGSGMGWVWTLGGVLYVGWLMGHFLSLRLLPQGREWVLLALFGTFLNDTAAYTVGRLVGSRKLAPRISPGKTWEGALGALVLSTLGVPLLAQAFTLPVHWSFPLLGLALSLAAQAGDLAESLLKRMAGVKEVSALVPGHGGLLDRMDSLVFVGPLVYYYVRWCVTPS